MSKRDRRTEGFYGSKRAKERSKTKEDRYTIRLKTNDKAMIKARKVNQKIG